MILGIDEVGRGPWAGPLVVGAVVLPDNFTLEGLTDSKRLTATKRQLLDSAIRQQALGYGLGWVYADELDEVGLSRALQLATIRAVEAVRAPYHEIVIDGTINLLKDTTKGKYVTTLPKADALIPAVSAASIIAKVARDAYMEEQDAFYPEYGFRTNVGYGTAVHQKALAEYGATPLHRASFAPVAKVLGGHPETGSATPQKNTTTRIGRVAESAVAQWLKGQELHVVEQNWRTKYCEIDLIAESSTTRYFIEVKYRSSSWQGGGLAAITENKLQRMRFAAELYIANHPTVKTQKTAVVACGAGQAIELLEVE